MTDEMINLTWRETGVANWARDCGFVATKDGDLFHLSGRNPSVRVLAYVELAEIERYLESL
ncbi:MAG: hypothetical protein ABIQ73_11770 [Acidimicrobiales bacterium]